MEMSPASACGPCSAWGLVASWVLAASAHVARCRCRGVRGGHGGLASALSVEGHAGGGGRERPSASYSDWSEAGPLGAVPVERAEQEGQESFHQLHQWWWQSKCLICERQLGPAVNCSVVFLLLFFQHIKVGPLPLAFTLMLRLELGSELGEGPR